MAKNTTNKLNSVQTLGSTMMRKEFWVGLVTTLIILLVGLKLIPWDSVQEATANKIVTVLSAIPSTSSSTATSAGSLVASKSASSGMGTSTATVEAKMNRTSVNALADTEGGYYTVQENDSYYTISIKVCGNRKNTEYIQTQNNFEALYAGNTVIVTCVE